MIAGSFPPGEGIAIVSLSRQSKRLYIGGVPDSMDEDQLKDFFNKLMAEHKFAAEMPGEPVAQAQINREKAFAFIEVGQLMTCRLLAVADSLSSCAPWTKLLLRSPSTVQCTMGSPFASNDQRTI